jgi:hypothetical protein
VKPNLYQPTSGIVVTITLEFLDKYGIQLCECHTRESIQSKTSTLLQSLSVLYHTIKQRSSTRLDMYQPKFGLAAGTTTMQFVAFSEMSSLKQWPHSGYRESQSRPLTCQKVYMCFTKELPKVVE